MTGYNKKAISSVELRFVKQNDQLRQFSLSGHFGRDMLAGSMAPGSSQLNLSTRDAGSLLSFIDLYRHMENGELATTLQLGNDTLGGWLEIKDFLLRDEPAIQRAGRGGGSAGGDPARFRACQGRCHRDTLRQIAGAVSARRNASRTA